MIYVVRNGKDFGPYSEQQVLEYVNNGYVVLHDVAREVESGRTSTVGDLLRRYGLTPKVMHEGSLMSQLKKIGSDLIIPKDTFVKRQWLSDKTLVVLAIIGLFPTFILLLPMTELAVFYVIALYFSCIWGLFFYYLFKTPQVSLKTTISVFFLTQLFVFVVWNLLGLVRFNPFYYFINSPFPFDLLGFVFGVGLTEEAAKMVPLFYVSKKSREPLMPRTMVFYGLMSGIAFGVFEGVQYQVSVNTQMDYTSAFYSNIARLTSLPFLHAIWCAIAGYFIAFANLYPKYRRSLYFLAFAIPALLHGLYDTFCQTSTLIALIVSFLGVFLLMTYLKRGSDYQHRLKQ